MADFAVFIVLNIHFFAVITSILLNMKIPILPFFTG
jgi:hypothetical protein